ncbi:enhancer of polycomb-like protein [Favolaschia claudopus]|uniref:Enhancer of polycomb-like protein n=1 Tax=Favolaschia claudopus TaxID=2862362 RepID=A0AAW0BM23_9AGAR
MAPRVLLPQKKNRARCGIKYSLKIYKGDLPPDSECLDDLEDENAAQMAVADVDINEGNEHHLQAALATKAVFIPTPGSISAVDNYEELYPPGKWKDPASYLKTTQTVEEACINGLVEQDYNYYIDEMDKQWLDKNNQAARGEGTSAQGARAVRKGKDKSPEIGVPVSISEDEFEFVMGVLEKLTDRKVLEDDSPDFSLYEHFFLEPLPPDVFASYVAPSWVPPPALLVRIARTIFPHWKQRRANANGRQLRPTLNASTSFSAFDEGDFENEVYVCFRHRDNKPVRKTRSGQAANSGDKLAQLDQNLSQAMDVATALFVREKTKQEAAVHSQNVWNVRQPMADMLRKFPNLITKADEERLLDKPRKSKSHRASYVLFPKVKVLPPSHPATPSAALGGQAVLPSVRCAALQHEIVKGMQRESQLIKENNLVDSIEDPYQTPLVPRAEKLWVDPPPSHPPPDTDADGSMSGRSGHSIRLRYGRGGRRMLDRRSTGHPYLSQLRNHRQHAEDDLDEETVSRLQGQWRFDADSTPSEENRELVDEWDTRYLTQRLAWATKEEATLIPDLSLTVQLKDGRDFRILPDQMLANVSLIQQVYEHPSLSQYLEAEGITVYPLRPRPSSSARPSPQKPTPVSSPSQNPASHPRMQAPMRPPPSPAVPKKTESPPVRAPTAYPAPPKSQENISPQPGTPTASAAPSRPRLNGTLPQNSNSIIPTANGDAVKGGAAVSASVNVNGHSARQPQSSPAPPSHPLQTNGARTAGPAYVPLNASSMTLKLASSRTPARPSPLTNQPVVASPLASSSSSRTSES